MFLAKRIIRSGRTILTVRTFGLGAEDIETDVNLANSILFMKSQRKVVIMSNIGICAMVWGVTYASSVYGVANVIKYYGFPWLEVSHWCKHVKFLI